mmetsp:Transcript_23500/g.32960  ORF Transcript_23500/g.32960 Transcript_23500/m.32960 type:complete len:203 (-) Transcript_23500:101-709(-)
MRFSRFSTSSIFYYYCVIMAMMTSQPSFLVSGTTATSDYESKCREWGFDIYQLSCETCDLLPTPQHQSICQTCCQSWKTLTTRTERYGYAIMVEGSYMTDNMEEFVNEDIQKVKDATSNGFQFIKGDGKNNNNNMMTGGLGAFGRMMGGSASQLYFFDKEPSNIKDESTFADQAKKTIDLHGWKRDDLRDMLITLLTGDEKK